MPLDFNDWREIQKLVGRMLAEKGEYFIQGIVIKNDETNKLVWLKELGDQPIPIIAFDYRVTYYYDTAGQTTKKKTTPYSREVEVLVPQVGDMVLVAKYFGSRRLPKCLGVIKSKDYLGRSED